MIVKFTKRVCRSFHGLSNRDVELYRYINLPFAPFIGLKVVYGNWEAEVVKVTYLVGTCEIVAATAADHPLKESTEQSMREALEGWAEMGWYIPQGNNDLFNSRFVGRCDCWVCRYSKNPHRSDECPHPPWPHNGTPEEEALKDAYRQHMLIANKSTPNE